MKTSWEVQRTLFEHFIFFEEINGELSSPAVKENFLNFSSVAVQCEGFSCLDREREREKWKVLDEAKKMRFLLQISWVALPKREKKNFLLQQQKASTSSGAVDCVHLNPCRVWASRRIIVVDSHKSCEKWKFSQTNSKLTLVSLGFLSIWENLVPLQLPSLSCLRDCLNTREMIRNVSFPAHFFSSFSTCRNNAQKHQNIIFTST